MILQGGLSVDEKTRDQAQERTKNIYNSVTQEIKKKSSNSQLKVKLFSTLSIILQFYIHISYFIWSNDRICRFNLQPLHTLWTLPGDNSK